MQLKDFLLDEETAHALPFLLDLDKKIPIQSKIRWNKLLSFREYLIDLVVTDYEKAVAIYDLIKNANNDNGKVAKKTLIDKLGKQRSWIESEKTVGMQILEKALSPAIEKISSHIIYISKLKPPHEFSSSYQSSTKIKANSILTAIRLFEDIHSSLYRRGIYTSSHESNEMIILDFPSDTSEDDLPLATNENIPEIREIPKLPLQGKVNEWIPLTTLTMNDSISEFKADFPHKLGYSKSAKQYYVMPLVTAENDIYEVSYKLSMGRQSTIEYNSSTQLNENEQACLACLRDFQFKDEEKRQTLKSQFAFLPLTRKLIILQIFFHGFQDENLSKLYATPTIPAFNLMLKERKGVCIQRAILCREIAEILGLTARVNINDIHALCELENYRVDLGGGRANIIEYTPDLELYFQPISLTMPKLLESVLATSSLSQASLAPKIQQMASLNVAKVSDYDQLALFKKRIGNANISIPALSPSIENATHDVRKLTPVIFDVLNK